MDGKMMVRKMAESLGLGNTRLQPQIEAAGQAIADQTKAELTQGNADRKTYANYKQSVFAGQL